MIIRKSLPEYFAGWSQWQTSKAKCRLNYFYLPFEMSFCSNIDGCKCIYSDNLCLSPQERIKNRHITETKTTQWSQWYTSKPERRFIYFYLPFEMSFCFNTDGCEYIYSDNWYVNLPKNVSRINLLRRLKQDFMSSKTSSHKILGFYVQIITSQVHWLFKRRFRYNKISKFRYENIVLDI